MCDSTHIAFLCGHFSYHGVPSETSILNHGWRNVTYDNEMIKKKSRIFYPEFAEFFMANSVSGCRQFEKIINKKVLIGINGVLYEILLKNLSLFVMPFNTIIVSIGIEHKSPNINDYTLVLSALRCVDYYSFEDVNNLKDFFDEAILPILNICPLFGRNDINNPSDLIEYGNKFKIFQILNCDKKMQLESSQNDLRLYELASVSRFSNLSEGFTESEISIEYFDSIVKKNKITVFNNWCGLALMDTFSVLSYDAPEWLVKNWTEVYFKNIYIYAIYQKFYLFSLNNKYKRQNLHPLKLEREFEQFETACCFHKISYNFLPLYINDALNKGLEIYEEKNMLHDIIEKECVRKRNANDKKINNILICISILTLSSAIWDFSCLVNEIYPYTYYFGDSIFGYRIIVIMCTILITILVIIIWRKRR